MAKAKSHDKAYVLVEATKLLNPKSDKRLRRRVNDLVLERKRRLTPF